MGSRFRKRSQVPIAAANRRDDISPQESCDLKVKDRQCRQVDRFEFLTEAVARLDDASLVVVLEGPERRGADVDRTAIMAVSQLMLTQVERMKRFDPIIWADLLNEKAVRPGAGEDWNGKGGCEADGVHKAVKCAALRRFAHRYPRDR